jgi:hypothetical protein
MPVRCRESRSCDCDAHLFAGELTPTSAPREPHRSSPRAAHHLYYPKMIRCLRLLAAILSTGVATSGMTMATAEADPSAEPEQSCTYTLSAPQLVVGSGATMVTATLSPFPCTDGINPNSMTVCVRTAGDDSGGECSSEARPIAARVFVPYRPGTTYQSTGRGCGSTFDGAPTTCTTVGPQSTTL